MNLKQKLVFLTPALDSIIDHDDAPFAEVEAMMTGIKTYVDTQLDSAKQRRAAAAARKAQEIKAQEDAVRAIE